jgi:hypothetical protein
MTLMGQSLIILLGLNVDFNRYYLPFVLLSAIGIGVGVGELTGLALSLRLRRQRLANCPEPNMA